MKIQIKEHQKHCWLMFCFALVVVVLSWCFAEIIPANNGFGWDGFWRYRPLLMNPGDVYRYHYLDTYLVQRLLPWGLIWAVFKLGSIPRTDEILVFACRVYQSLMLIISVPLWCLIARQLKLTVSAMWIGFIALFVNYCVLKAHIYYPVLGDSTAVLVGMLSFYFYVSNRFFSLFLISILSLMVWPTSLFYQSALLLFPFGSGHRDTAAPGKLRFYIASGLILLFWFVFSASVSRGIDGITPPISSLIPLALVGASAFIFLAETELLRTLSFTSLKSGISEKTGLNKALPRIGAVLVLLLFYLFLTRVLAQKAFSFTTWDYARTVTCSATAKPLGFAVSHVIYYGPFLLLVIRYYKHFCQVVRRTGFGVVAVLAMMIMQMLGCETRQLANVLIYLAAPCALMMQRVRRGLVIKLFVCSLFMSHFWLPLNMWNQAPLIAISYPSIGLRWEFPAQFYFMHEGLYLSNLMYFVHLPFLALVWFFLGLHKPLSAHLAEDPAVLPQPYQVLLSN